MRPSLLPTVSLDATCVVSPGRPGPRHNRAALHVVLCKSPPAVCHRAANHGNERHIKPAPREAKAARPRQTRTAVERWYHVCTTVARMIGPGRWLLLAGFFQRTIWQIEARYVRAIASSRCCKRVFDPPTAKSQCTRWCYRPRGRDGAVRNVKMGKPKFATLGGPVPHTRRRVATVKVRSVARGGKPEAMARRWRGTKRARMDTRGRRTAAIVHGMVRAKRCAMNIKQREVATLGIAANLNARNAMGWIAGMRLRALADAQRRRAPGVPHRGDRAGALGRVPDAQLEGLRAHLRG